jgi:hypothetical protein
VRYYFPPRCLIAGWINANKNTDNILERVGDKIALEDVLMPKGYKVHGYIANEKWKYET